MALPISADARPNWNERAPAQVVRQTAVQKKATGRESDGRFHSVPLPCHGAAYKLRLLNIALFRLQTLRLLVVDALDFDHVRGHRWRDIR